MKDLFRSVKAFLREYLSLRGDTDYEYNTIEAVKRGVAFKGVKLWTLIFATFIASIGLNVNSTAVIIGAMLISPLMGPILGLGLGAAQYDFPLIKRSFKNLLVATVFSIATSWLYFRLTPLAQAQSELLARTSPTLWDVLIALFGGLTGMVAVASKEKGNPIAGVAIATALMPPLCTAGFGLAVGNVSFFVGALYLYIINGVMIALGTFLVAKLLKYPLVEMCTDKQRLTKRAITLITLVIIAPSVYLAYDLVKNTVYENAVERFIAAEFDRPDAQVLRKELIRDPQGGRTLLRVFMIGSTPDSADYRRMCQQMERYSLADTQLDVVNVAAGRENGREGVSSEVLMSFYRANERSAREKDSVIAALESELTALRSVRLPVPRVAREVRALFPEVDSIALGMGECAATVEGGDTGSAAVVLAAVYCSQGLRRERAETLRGWLEERLESPQVFLFVRP